ncbi:pre-mRNA-splicing factor ATP-dependent RNA helicase PRP43, partial [Dactylonectria macrodidyma]
GYLAAACPLDPIWYHAIEEGAKLGCAQDIADIAAVCSSQKDIFLRPVDHLHAADVPSRAMAGLPSDHLTLANAFNLYMHTREENQKGEAPRVDLDAWCRQYFLDIAVLEEVRKTREAVGRFMKNASKTPATRASGRDTESVRKALAIAFCTQTAIYDGSSDNYRTVHENVLARLAPLSVLLNGKYEWIVYTALNATGGKVFLETATPINAEWLVDLPYFQDERLPRKKDKLKSLRQPKVKISLDAAKARLTAAKARLDAAETN